MSELVEVRRKSRAAVYVAVALAVLVVVFVAWGTVGRAADLSRGHDVPVVIPLTDTQAEFLFGLDRTGDHMDINSITVVVDQPDRGTMTALWADTAARFLAAVVGVALGAIVLVRIAQARILESNSSSLVFTGAVVGVAYWLGHAGLANAAAAQFRESYFAEPLEAGPLVGGFAPLVLALCLTGAGLALKMGERLHRDTEGLV